MSISRPIITSLSPNTERDDSAVAARTLLSAHRWPSHARQIPQIEQEIGDILGGQHVTLTSSGRGALYEALRAANIGAGDEVVIQAFTCLAVSAAIIWTGAKPVYADIDPQTYNLNAATVQPHLTPRTKALIIQHTFGIPAPLKELMALAREHSLLVIEDIAHAFGGTVEGQPLGSFGDIAILSFGRDKTISCVYGGAVATRDEGLHAKLRQQMASYKQPPTWWNIQQLLHPLIMNIVVPLYFTAGIGKIILVVSQRMGFLSMAVSAEEKTRGVQPAFMHYTFSAALVPLLENQLKKLSRFTQQRQQIVQTYLHHFPEYSSFKAIATQASLLRFPIRVKNRPQFFAKAKNNKILLGDWYATPVTPCSLDQQNITQYIPGSCPEAEKAATQIINLPTHTRLTPDDIERIIKVIKKHD